MTAGLLSLWNLRAKNPARATPRHEEDTLQAAVVATLRLSHPNIRVFAVPNGGKRNAREAARMVAQGTLAGVSDLVVVWPGRVAFIELKAPGKVTGEKRPLAALSPAQLAWYGTLQGWGIPVTVCDSVAMVETWLREQGCPLRTHTGRVA
jgi:hypothetical protein